jgi:hypothetical protein
MKVFRPTRELAIEQRRLHYGEVSDLYCSPNIIMVIISKRMGRAGMLQAWEKRGIADCVLILRLQA